ncbi:NADPH-dependent FMN reductase [Psychromonas ingrahamii 37]|uniref:NADPH-dependent FMN reductase n=1 Tax=Psychromonas ingrahamii (strain DSM 17664 / CCUG 51855 / 37) TaxID=357804 RepID=A1SS78_PSYIN|nr:flavodoxin family protein [Psychromonas ingrahamii]ABM02343.1 NADPH-dependent FMN reductase [Psychromonas ingrahamii 37]
MNKILAINGSYRDDGITDQAVAALVKAVESAGAEVEVILLREYPIEFCRNCRECTQQPGESPGNCVQHDGMEELIKKIEQADGYILAAPTNFGSVTAIFKRFMERLIVYAYWPWDKNSPEFRKTNAQKKKAILVSSCAAPGILGRLIYGTHKQLKMTAQTIGAKTVGTVFVGLIAKDSQQKLANNIHRKVQKLSAKLLE